MVAITTECHIEPVSTMEKHQPAAAKFGRASRLLWHTVLTPALTLTLLIYARSSLPALLSLALGHTSKEAMFFFCNGILLFLAKDFTPTARPKRPSAAEAGYSDGTAEPSAACSMGGRALPEMPLMSVPDVVGAVVKTGVASPEVVDLFETELTASQYMDHVLEPEVAGPEDVDAVEAELTAVIVVKEPEEQVEVDALIAVEAGDTFEEDVMEEVYGLHPEGELDDCHLSSEDLNKKAEEFIQNFRRQMRFESMRMQPLDE